MSRQMVIANSVCKVLSDICVITTLQLAERLLMGSVPLRGVKPLARMP